MLHRRLAGADGLQDLPHLRDPFAAGGTLPARFILQEGEEEAGEIHHAVVFVHHDHAAGAHHRADFDQLVVVDRQVQVLLSQDPARRAAGLHAFELFAVLDAAADIVDDLAERRAHGHLDQARAVHFAHQGEDFRSLAPAPGAPGDVAGADGREPVGAPVDNERNVRPGLDVVERGGTVPQAALDGMHVLGARLAGPAFDRRHQGRRFAANKRAPAPVDPDVEAVARAEDVLAEKSLAPGIDNRLVHQLHGKGILGPHVHVALASPNGIGADDHALDDAVRVAFHEAAVGIRAGVALVGVADDVLEVALRLAARGPLGAGGETRPATAAQSGPGHLVNNLVRRHRREGFDQGRVAADADVIVNAGGIQLEVGAKEDRGLIPVEGDFFPGAHGLAGLGILHEKPLDLLAADQGLLDDLGDVGGLHFGVDQPLRPDRDDRTLFAETEAAGHAQVHLAGRPFSWSAWRKAAATSRLTFARHPVPPQTVTHVRFGSCSARSHCRYSANCSQEVNWFIIAVFRPRCVRLEGLLRLGWREVSVVLRVDHDHRGQRAGSQAVDRFQGELAVLRGLPRLDLQLAFQRVQYPRRPAHVAGRAQAHADNMFAARREAESLVERGHVVNAQQRDAHASAHVAQRRLGKVAQTRG